MTASKSAAMLAAAVLLTACAARQAPPAPPLPEPEIADSGLPLRMAMTGQPARLLLEQVAAACWLDHVVRGGSMIVDRRTGRVVITSDTEDLLIAEVMPAGDGTSLVRVTGPAAENPATAVRLSETLETAVTTGRPGCAPAAA